MADRARRRDPWRSALLRGLSRAEAVVGATLLAVIFALTLLQAAQRYLPGGGWVWAGELARFAFVWLAFAMAGYLVANGGHITLKLIDTVTGPRLLRLVRIIADVTVAVVCLNLAYEAYRLMVTVQQTSPALGLPMGLFYVIPLGGLLLTALRSVVSVFCPAPEAGTGAAEEAGSPAGTPGREGDSA